MGQVSQLPEERTGLNAPQELQDAKVGGEVSRHELSMVTLTARSGRVLSDDLKLSS